VQHEVERRGVVEVLPSARSFSTTSGELITLRTASFNRITTDFGVPAGESTPMYVDAS
jgi:hypothetical protein